MQQEAKLEVTAASSKHAIPMAERNSCVAIACKVGADSNYPTGPPLIDRRSFKITTLSDKRTCGTSRHHVKLRSDDQHYFLPPLLFVPPMQATSECASFLIDNCMVLTSAIFENSQAPHFT